MADLVSGFQGTVNDPQKGFAWIPPSRKGSPRIWMVLIPLILSMTGFLYYWVERTDRHLESIHDERIKLQQQLEDQRKRVQESRAISGKFEQVRLQSRSKIQIKGRDVIRISLKMNIAPGKAKRNKNNE